MRSSGGDLQLLIGLGDGAVISHNLVIDWTPTGDPSITFGNRKTMQVGSAPVMLSHNRITDRIVAISDRTALLAEENGRMSFAPMNVKVSLIGFVASCMKSYSIFPERDLGVIHRYCRSRQLSTHRHSGRPRLYQDHQLEEAAHQKGSPVVFPSPVFTDSWCRSPSTDTHPSRLPTMRISITTESPLSRKKSIKNMGISSEQVVSTS